MAKQPRPRKARTVRPEKAYFMAYITLETRRLIRDVAHYTNTPLTDLVEKALTSYVEQMRVAGVPGIEQATLTAKLDAPVNMELEDQVVTRDEAKALHTAKTKELVAGGMHVLDAMAEALNHLPSKARKIMEEIVLPPTET